MQGDCHHGSGFSPYQGSGVRILTGVTGLSVNPFSNDLCKSEENVNSIPKRIGSVPSPWEFVQPEYKRACLWSRTV